MKFEYTVDLKEGYKSTMQDTEETELTFVITAKNRATADRMVKALLKDARNVNECIGVCIDD
jgi:hypothetical protein